VPRALEAPVSAPVVRALVALAIVAGAVWVSVTTPARLGLDLRGGTQIVLETQDSATVKAGTESTDRAVEVLRRRVDALGVSEPSLTRSGDRRIIVELPGVQDPREAAEVIGRTAQLTFHPVLGTAVPTAPPSPSAAESPAPSAPPGAAILNGHFRTSAWSTWAAKSYRVISRTAGPPAGEWRTGTVQLSVP